MALALGAILRMFWVARDAGGTSGLERTERGIGTSPRQFATCAKPRKPWLPGPVSPEPSSHWVSLGAGS
jgi:hypothetical protein